MSSSIRASATEAAAPAAATLRPRPGALRLLARRLALHRGVPIGAVLLLLVAASALLAPFLGLPDPQAINPIERLMPPGPGHPFGTDNLGRDILSRTLHGGRVSLVVGLVVSMLAASLGMVIGLIAGYVRLADAVLMRVMDGIMAIPAILLAIAMVALTRPSVLNVIVAVTVVEVPRVVRLVRSVVLTIREQPYVEAAVSIGTRLPLILIRHVLPNATAPLIVQATYIAAAAILVESLLSFLGAGTPPSVPTWGNVVAEGRNYFQLAPWIVLFPGLFLAVTVLAINLMGDGLRDMLDPRTARRI